MTGADKTKEQLTQELEMLRARVVELEQAEVERKQAEQALRESEERYRDLYEEAPYAYFSVGSNGRIRMANRRAVELVGYDLDALVGRPVFDLYADTPAGKGKAQEVYARFLAGKEVCGQELEMRRADGRSVWVSLTVRPILDREGEVVASRSMVVDITERKRAEDALRDSEAHYRAIVETFDGLIYICSQDYRVEFMNRQLIERTGYDGTGKLCYKVLHDIDTVCPWCVNARVFSGETVRWEVQSPKDGRWYYVVNAPIYHTDGSISKQAMIQDITERKRAEEALRRRAAELETLCEVSLAITAKLDLDALLHSIAERAVKLLDAEAGGMYLYQPERDVLVWAAGVGPGFGPPFLELRRGEGLSGKVWETGEPLIVDDYRHWEGRAAVPEGYPWTAILGVPIGRDEEFLGVINVQADNKVRTFTPDDAHLLSLLAAQAAAAIRNSQLYEALRESEERYRTLFESSPESIFLIGSDSRVIDCNNATEVLADRPKEEMIGKPFTELGALPEEDLPQRMAIFARLLNEEDVKPLEAQIITKGGDLRLLEVHPALLKKDDKVWAIQVIGRDITERKRAEEERQTHLRFLESMDQVNRAIQGTNDLEQMMSDVLDVVLSTFNCDRAFLLYPCDPKASSWRVPMERNRPEYPGVLALGLEMPMDAEVAETLRILLDSDGPVKFGPGTAHPLPTDVSDRFGFKSFMSMALHPKVGKPWQFGIHQCSYPRVWTPQEERLLQGIGQRLADTLTSLLAYRNLQESELRYRELFENSSECIFLLDVTEDGRFKFAEFNPAEERAVGFSNAEVSGKFIEEAIPAELAQQVIANYRRCVEAGTIINYDEELNLPVGRRDFHTTLIPVRNAAGDIYRIVGVARDTTEQVQTEQELQCSNDLLRAVIEAAPTAIIGLDLDGNVQSVWNPAAEKMLGWSAQEVMGCPLPSVPVESQEEFRHLRERIRSGLTLDGVEVLRQRRDGSPIDYSIYASPLHDAEGRITGNITVLVDITERKRAEEAIRQHNRELAALNAVSTVVSQSLNLDEILNAGLDKALELMRLDVGGVYLVDPVNLRLNLAAHRGVSSRYVDEVESINVDKKSIEAAIAQGRLEGFILPVETFIKNRAELRRIKSAMQREGLSLASAIPVLLQAKEEIVGAMVVASREPRRYSEAELQLLTSIGQQIAVAIYNARLYEAEQYERVLAQTLRRSAETLVRSAHLEDTLPHIVDQLKAVVQFDRAMVMLAEGSHLRVVEARGFPDQAQMIGRSYYYPDIPLLHASLTSDEPVVVEDAQNDPRWVELPDGIISRGGWLGARLVVWETVKGLLCIGTREPFIYDAQDVEAVAAFAHQTAFALEHARTVEELEARVSDLQETQGHLVRAARLSAAGEIAAGVAHQINNPLTAVIAESGLLLSEVGPDGPGHESAVAISEAAERAGVVTQRLLDLARLGPISMQPVDVNRSLQSAISLVRAQIEPSIRLITVLAPNLPPIQANREHLEDAWINLLLNAKDAIGGAEGGVIRVSSAPGVEGIKVTIQDNGVGIPPEHIDRVFDPFFTTKAYGRGTGLGLSICYDVVARHNGSINVESKEGQGATFVVTLPLNPGRLKPDHP